MTRTETLEALRKHAKEERRRNSARALWIAFGLIPAIVLAIVLAYTGLMLLSA